MLHNLALSTGLTKIALNINPEVDKHIKERLEQRAKRISNEPFIGTPINRKKLIKNTTFVSPSSALRHKTVGATKRFLGGKGGFNSKWGNRAAVLAGLLGATGLGIRAYNERAKKQNLTSSPVYEYPRPRYLSYEDIANYSKMGSPNKYVHDTAVIPPPVKQPRVPTPGPSTKPISLDDKIDSNIPTPKALKEKKASDSTDFLLASGLGGTGGWLLGKKLIEPLIAEKERRLQIALNNLQKTKQYAPIGAAAAGAIILAALSSLRQKKERTSAGILDPSKFKHVNNDRQQIDPRYLPYDITNSGFVPNDLYNL